MTDARRCTRRIATLASTVTGAAVNALKVVLREGTFAVGLLIYLIYSNWQLTSVFLLALPLSTVAATTETVKRLEDKSPESLNR